MPISLIVTVRNEESSVGAFLQSVAQQTRQPDEIVIVDACSTDRTAEIIRSFDSLPIRLICERSNIARGRNIAIAAARGDVIAVSDGGCRLDPRWLEHLAEEMENADVVAGNYRPTLRTLFDACQYSLVGLFKSDASLEKFCVSSRSLAFRKQVWEEEGGYPEWLDYSEDMYFHGRIFAAPHRARFARNAFVEWEQRPTVGALYRQYFRYMQGDGLARMHTQRHAIRFATYAIGLALLAMSMVQPLALAVLLPGSLLYLSVPYRAFVRLRCFSLAGRALAIIPALVVVMDTAKMAGYVSGLVRRFRRLSGAATAKSVGAIASLLNAPSANVS